jgi:peptidoglycan/LPS O-acetylase OafA/YrhL
VGYQKGILEGLVGLFAMSILIYMSRSKQTIIRNAFSWKPLAFIGTFSYSLYLLHQPLLNVVLRGGKIFHLDNDGRFLFALVIGVPLIVCVAYAFFCVGEKPFMRKPSRVVPSFGVSNKDETISVAHQ